jgi:hypothetical protein
MTGTATLTRSPATEPLIADIRRVLGDNDPSPAQLEAIGALLRRWVRSAPVHTAIEDLIRNRAHEASIRLGAIAEEVTLWLARIPSGHQAAERKQVRWGLACTVVGSVWLFTWRRTLPDGELRQIDAILLEPRDVFWFHGSARDCHSQQALDRPAWQLVLHASPAPPA